MATRVVRAAFKKKHTNLVFSQVFLASAIIASSFIISRTGSNSDKDKFTLAPIVNEFDSVYLHVPSEAVAAGTKVKDINFKKIAYPKHQLPSNSLQNLDGLADYVAITALPANLPLFRENFSQAVHIKNPVQEKIPPGMRAMTIRVDATTAVEGWAGSGSVVDILLIEKERTTVVAERVRILSAERSVAPVEGQSAPTVPSTVTLLVSQEQCLAINTAIPLGKIAFALRSTKDEAAWNDTEFKSEQLLKKQQVASNNPVRIRGVLSIRDLDKSFALTDGRWVKTEQLPKGFFVNSEQQKN